jgi:competence protein ComEC
MAHESTVVSTVLKVPHHGSANGVDEFFIEVDPEMAVISCGVGNSYGHPAQSTLDILENIGTDVHRTDLEGSLHISVRKEGGITFPKGLF